jgi:ankyrin repeat protein
LVYRDESVKVDYSGCLEQLVRSGRSRPALSALINRQDLLGNTPLHYAVQFWSQQTVTQLLLLGERYYLFINIRYL